MGDSIVIDTCVLIHATDNNEKGEDFLNCLSIVESLLTDDEIRLAVDSDYEIMKEYEDQLVGRSDHIAKAIKKYVVDKTRSDRSSIVSFEIPIPESQVEELSEMGFHSSDMKFVRVGPASDYQVIISTDDNSFFEEEYKQWIENNLDVDLKKPEEGVNIL